MDWTGGLGGEGDAYARVHAIFSAFFFLHLRSKFFCILIIQHAIALTHAQRCEKAHVIA